MTLKQSIKSWISKILNELGIKDKISFSITIPQDLQHGDFTANAAFAAAKILKKSPLQVAGEISERLKKENEKLKTFAKIEALKPGFINFYLSEDYLISQMNEVISNPEKAGKTEEMKGKRIMIEFTDPNPFKEFHIGHLYTNTVGESLSRLFEANGAVVWRADYFGDVGMHVAKAVWGILHTDIKNPENKEIFYSENLDKLIEYAGEILSFLESKILNDKIKFMGQGYALGSTAYEKSERAKEDIKHLNKLIYIAAQKMWKKEKGLKAEVDYQKAEKLNEKEFDMVYQLYTKGRLWSLEYFETIYERLGMKFRGYYPESISGERGYKLVKEHIKDGIFIKHDGAVIFEGEKYGLHNRVFINSLGLPTYEAKELGLAPWKYEEFPYDQSIILTGNEINEYFKVLIKALSLINPDLAGKTIHIGHGMVRLPEGKMSSRTGKIITGEWLLDEVTKKAKEKILEVKHSAESGEINSLDEISDKVGIGAVKYAMLKSSIGRDIEFNFETSVSFEGNSGPYLQYSYVRTQSILEKYQGERGKGKGKSIESSSIYTSSFTLHPEELTLLRLANQFPYITAESAENLAPNTLCSYLYELAKQFNLFYQTHRIIDAQNPQEVNFRLCLTSEIGIILKQGLHFLGIAAPKRM